MITENFAVVDIETTGLDPVLNSILSIGAVDFLTGDEFYIEMRAKDNDPISDFALAVNGFTKEQCYIPTTSQVEGYMEFLKWASSLKLNLIGGQQVGSFDILFLKEIHKQVTEKWSFGHRSIDLHSVYFGKTGKSLSLDGILQGLGLQPEPKPHNALTGAKLERDAFKLLLK